MLMYKFKNIFLLDIATKKSEDSRHKLKRKRNENMFSSMEEINNEIKETKNKLKKLEAMQI